MTNPCGQEVPIAEIQMRLKYGDGILETLVTDVKKLGQDIANSLSLINALTEHIVGDNGLIATQKEHSKIVNKIIDREVLEKVERHDKAYIIGAFIIGFLGLGCITGVWAMMNLADKLVKLMGN